MLLLGQSIEDRRKPPPGHDATHLGRQSVALVILVRVWCGIPVWLREMAQMVRRTSSRRPWCACAPTLLITHWARRLPALARTAGRLTAGGLGAPILASTGVVTSGTSRAADT